MSSLITQYKTGEYVGVLAESWTTNSGFKQWRFKLRAGLVFENGDPITPEIIVRSLMRIAYFQKKNHSESGFLEQLVGFNQITSPSSSIDGIKIENKELVFTFENPIPKLLDTVGFGLYAVVHPNDYDEKTGVWKNPKKFTSSGSYRIKYWNDDSLVLELRNHFFPSLRHPKPLNVIKFTWQPEDRVKADIVVGNSNEHDLANKVFNGSVAAYTAYVFCQSWSEKRSICHDIHYRRLLRHEFYQALRQEGIIPTLSFFPLAIAGIKESTEENVSGKMGVVIPLHFNRSRNPNPLFTTYNVAMKKASQALEIPAIETQFSFETVFREADPYLPRYSFDVAMRGTGILVDDPLADIRFMVLSKEGIRLPDVDGRIKKELKKVQFDPQVINELLWDQAVVWPVGHYASGLWANPAFDFSMINLVLPPTDLSWIGWK